MESHMARFRLKRISTQKPNLTLSSEAKRTPNSAVSRRRRTSCRRCRDLKKRCTRTLPECGACIAAGVDCSLATDTPPSSSSNDSYGKIQGRLPRITNVNSPCSPLGGHPATEQTTAGGSPSDSLSPSDQVTSGLATAFPALGRPHLPPSSPALPNNAVDSAAAESCLGRKVDTSLTHVKPSPQLKPPQLQGPALANETVVQGVGKLCGSPVALALVDAYFRDAHRCCPFLDKCTMLATIQKIGNRTPEQTISDTDLIMAYLVMAIGYSTLKRNQCLPSDAESKPKVESESIFLKCRMLDGVDSVDSVQILILLTMFIMFDLDSTLKAQPLIDLASRRLVQLGLTRRSVESTGLSPLEIERNHRLFWSVYCYDRLMATSFGMPAALNGTTMSVPLPRMTVDEFASPECNEVIATLQVSRHIIQLRQLEDKVLHRIHLRRHVATDVLAPLDRREMVEDLRVAIGDWYSNGCLLTSTGCDDMSIYIRIPWLGARYYNLLLLLYYPSHFDSEETALTRHELVSLAQKHIRANHVRFQQRQLPHSHAMLCRLFPVCLVFMNTFASYGVHQQCPAVHEEVSMCADMMEVFPVDWILAHRAAALLRELALRIRRRISFSLVPDSLSEGSSSAPSPLSQALFEDDGRWCHTTKASFIQLMEQVLGKDSAYLPLKA